MNVQIKINPNIKEINQTLISYDPGPGLAFDFSLRLYFGK